MVHLTASPRSKRPVNLVGRQLSLLGPSLSRNGDRVRRPGRVLRVNERERVVVASREDDDVDLVALDHLVVDEVEVPLLVDVVESREKVNLLSPLFQRLGENLVERSSGRLVDGGLVGRVWRERQVLDR